MEDELAAWRERRRGELQQVAETAQADGAPVDVSQDSLPAFVKANRVVLVDVWASWCGPCRMMEPLVEELAHEWSGNVAVAKLNADENPDFLMEHGIQGIPTFLVFRDGKVAARLVGTQSKRTFNDAVARASA